MKGVLNDIKEWFLETAKVFRREFGMVFRDAGVMLFFFALPLAYPIVYAAIYNPEVTREMVTPPTWHRPADGGRRKNALP